VVVRIVLTLKKKSEMAKAKISFAYDEAMTATHCAKDDAYGHAAHRLLRVGWCG
jgi:hypothetical protein